jgi:lipopolysaccharide export system protein LptA
VKKIHFIALIAMLGGGSLPAQTNTGAAAETGRAPTLIDSDRADFDLGSSPRQAFYYGNVHVNDPQMKLTSAKMVADLPMTGGHISRIVAETNVVIDFLDDKGQTNHAISDKAVYIFNLQNGVTNETVTLSGHASVTNSDGSYMSGEPIIWDRVNNSVHTTDEHISIKQNISNAMGGTNSPTTKTNKPPAPKPF